MSSERDYILNKIKQPREKETEAIRSFFYDMTTNEEFRNPEDNIKEELITLTPGDESAFVHLSPPAYGNTLMIDSSKDTKGILQAYYLPHAQPHVVPFLKAQSAYLYDLEERWKEALSAYTYHGDRFINGFLRNSLNKYEFVKNTNSNNEYALKKRYTFIDLINSVRSSGVCPFKYAIKERYADLRKTLEGLPVMELNPTPTSISMEWVETDGRNFKFPPLSLSINDTEAFQKIMQSTWFNSIENLRPLVESLVVDLLKIFINSPRVTEDIVVYRGVKTNYYRPGLVTSKDFWSTSISPNVSVSFASNLGKNVNFTVEEITIKKDIPCLFISQYSKVGSGEWEILLPPGVKYFIEKDLYLKKMPPIPYNNTFTTDTYIKYMMNIDKPKEFVLVNSLRTDSFDREIPIVKKIFMEVEQRKALLNERRRMRHLGWVPGRRSVTRNRNRNRNQNRNKSRRRNEQRKQQRNKKWQNSDENNN